jgi:hypothetical protein
MHRLAPRLRAPGLAAALALLACAGAAPRQGAPAAAGGAPAASTTSTTSAAAAAPSRAARVQPLDDRASPLRDRFDADRAQPRLLVLASPT